MQHPQHIVAIPSRLVEHRVNGWCDYDIKSTDLIMACRDHLEKDSNYRQVIPITAFVKVPDDVNDRANYQVWCYIRGNKGGESRLHGKIATGVGGHWDLSDLVINDDSTIDLDNSISQSLKRELTEEIKLSNEGQGNFCVTLTTLLVADNSPVDRLHVGLITFVIVPSEVEIESREPDQLEALGFFTESQVRDLKYSTETWTDKIFECIQTKLSQESLDLISEAKRFV